MSAYSNTAEDRPRGRTVEDGPRGRKRKRGEAQNADLAVFNVLSQQVTSNLHRHDITSPLYTQSRILPLLLPGHRLRHNGDLCFQAPTGSGKTLTYIIPLIEDLKDQAVTKLRAAIVLPTRDLVKQVHGVLEKFAAGTGIKISTATGNRTLESERAVLVHEGSRYQPEEHRRLIEWAKRRLHYFDLEINHDSDVLRTDINDLLPDHVPEYTSNIDVLICTPGRLVQHLRTTTGFTLDDLEWLIIDEVDSLLDQSFQEWVEYVVAALEKGGPAKTAHPIILSHLRRSRRARRRHVRKIVLSATVNRDLWALKALKLRRPRVEIIPDPRDELETRQVSQPVNERLNDRAQQSLGDAPLADEGEEKRERERDVRLKEYAISVGDGSRKPLYLLKLLDSLPAGKKLVFCNVTEAAARLHRLLTILHPPYAPKLGLVTSTSASGLKDIAAFRTGRKTILIATDRASRGLDIPNLEHVINYDIPTWKVGSYTHRVGRTARAGQEGSAWSLVDKAEERHFWKGIVLARKLDGHTGKVEEYKVDIDNMTQYEKALARLETEVLTPQRDSWLTV